LHKLYHIAFVPTLEAMAKIFFDTQIRVYAAVKWASHSVLSVYFKTVKTHHIRHFYTVFYFLRIVHSFTLKANPHSEVDAATVRTGTFVGCVQFRDSISA
jgi:hypothetical protein